MADILIPDVPDDAIAAIDIKAQRLGFSRADYLRRVLARERDAQPVQVTVANLASFAETFAELDDPDVMSRAGHDAPASNQVGSFAALTDGELSRLLRDPDHFRSARASFSPNDFLAFANTAVD
jgi:hypothetical protein